MKKTLRQLSDRITAKKENGHITLRSKARAFLGAAATAGAFRTFAVKDFCRAYAVTQDTFTRLTGFSPRAVAHWVQGRKPSTSTERRLTEMKRIFESLETLVAKDAIGPWLKESSVGK